uniref:C2H2-type domain-containing protein n=1 Tax=Strigamia maritima TaxID=126957 RepID=T1J616_STRMM
MAVESQQLLMVEGTLAPDTVLVTESKDEDGSVSADILQQALQEASEEFDPQTNIEYENVENAVAVVHGDPNRVDGDVEMDEGLEEGEPDTTANANDIVTSTNTVPGTVRVFATTPQTSTSATTSSTTTIAAPIGSSANPIQIIQQGNTYHSTQMLSQEQLQQIAQVLQQQQQLSQLSPNGSTSVLYNAATNTRIVYRIIYPSDLNNKSKNVTAATEVKVQAAASIVKGRGRPRKPWGRRFEDVEEKTDVPEMSREEKEEKKKHRPRTRSGRISKPPKHMVKDYKRIHYLDFDDEPYDDSDGGYSDYHVSGEDDGSRSSTSSAATTGGVSTSKSRRYRCGSCDKSYIGRGGLSRHYRLYPGHGNADDIEPEIAGTSAASVDGMLSGPGTPAESSQASNDAILPSSSTPTFITSTPMPVKRGRGRPSSHEIASLRRKAKLEELIKHCENEELMETVLPRLAEVVSVWEFLLMKCEKGSPTRASIPDICKELESLIKQAQKVAQEYMTLVPEDSADANDDNINSKYELTSSHLAGMLGLTPGQYNVEEMQKPEAPIFRYKMLTADPTEIKRTHATRRTIEVVDAEDIVVSSPVKRRRMSAENETKPDINETNINLLPMEILQESQEDSLDFVQVGNASNGNNVFRDETEPKAENTETQPSPSETVEGKVVNDKPQAFENVENVTQVVETAFVNPNNTDETTENNRVLTELTDDGKTEKNTDELENENSTRIFLADAESSKLINLSENGNSQYITLQDADGQTILGQVLCHRNEDGEMVRQVMIPEGHVLSNSQLEGLAELPEYTTNIMPQNVVIVQNGDGTTTTVQLPSDQSFPLETVEALLAMDSEPQS